MKVDPIEMLFVGLFGEGAEDPGGAYHRKIKEALEEAAKTERDACSSIAVTMGAEDIAEAFHWKRRQHRRAR